MTARREIGVAVLVLMAAAFASPGLIAQDEGMCAPPALDTTKWKLMQVPEISIRVPPGFSQEYKDANNLAFESGPKTIQVAKGEGPDQLATNGGVTILSTCSTVIGGRPVTISVEHFSLYDRPRQPTGNAGPKYIAYARWGQINGLPTVSAWIVSNNRSDLHALKGIFYTANVGVRVPPPCVAQTPAPLPDSIVDSAAIAMSLSSKPARWPAGNATVQLKFDSAGALGAIAVTAGDLPDSTKRAVAMVVGTNVRERALGAPSIVQLRVTSAAAGVSYAVEKATVCPP